MSHRKIEYLPSVKSNQTRASILNLTGRGYIENSGKELIFLPSFKLKNGFLDLNDYIPQKILNFFNNQLEIAPCEKYY